MDDPFIRGYIDDVLRSLRTQWILEIIKPYTRIEIAYLARVSQSLFPLFTHRAITPTVASQQLGIPDSHVEEIVVALILDEKILGRIDQVTGRLELDRQCVQARPLGFETKHGTDRAFEIARSTAVETRRYQALDRWTSQLHSLHGQLLSKAAQVGADRMGPGAVPGGAAGSGSAAWASSSGWKAVAAA